MATERDDKPVVNSPAGLRELLSSAITCHMHPEVALLHIMKKYYFETDVLQQILNGLSPSVHSLLHLGLNHLFRGAYKHQLF